MMMKFFKRQKQRKLQKKQRELQLLREQAIKHINYLTIRYM